jgi:hypothetical protein
VSLGSPIGIGEPIGESLSVGKPIGELIDHFYSSYN